jgi:type IV pilus assembly protein PilE
MNGRLMHMAGRARGFTLVEVMIVMAIVAILVAIAYPGYTNYVVRSHRAAAQQELLSLAALQEKIYLNSSAYASNVTANYTGQSTGGLGKTSGRTSDDLYTLTVTVPAGGQSFTLTATPVTGTMQQDDGAMTINSSGIRAWGSENW